MDVQGVGLLSSFMLVVTTLIIITRHRFWVRRIFTKRKNLGAYQTLVQLVKVWFKFNLIKLLVSILSIVHIFKLMWFNILYAAYASWYDLVFIIYTLYIFLCSICLFIGVHSLSVFCLLVCTHLLICLLASGIILNFVKFSFPKLQILVKNGSYLMNIGSWSKPFPALRVMDYKVNYPCMWEWQCFGQKY